MSNLRILYAAGPGDIVGTFRYWLHGKDDPRVPDVAYSRQFLDVCQQVGADGWIISANPRRDLVEAGAIRAENRPITFDGRSGLIFHVGRALYTLGLIRSAIRFRADVVVAAHGVHWFLLSLLPLFGIKVVPAIHNTLWLALVPPRFTERVLLFLARPLFASWSLAILAHPGTCARQVSELASGRSRPIVPFLPFYREYAFTGVPQRGARRPPFRVMFAGRIEADKGVFDLLEVARQLTERHRLDIEFDICGAGSCLERLRREATAAGLAERFRCHGYLVEARALREIFGACHVVVVPTRSDYTEGFNAVVAEAILAGRPVITSRLCPAIDLVRDAAVEIPPNDVAACRDAILLLCDQDPIYEIKRNACSQLKAQFFDSRNSWGEGLSRILANTAKV